MGALLSWGSQGCLWSALFVKGDVWASLLCLSTRWPFCLPWWNGVAWNSSPGARPRLLGFLAPEPSAKWNSIIHNLPTLWHSVQAAENRLRHLSFHSNSLDSSVYFPLPVHLDWDSLRFRYCFHMWVVAATVDHLDENVVLVGGVCLLGVWSEVSTFKLQ
jgi:hypothetical protein